MFLRPIDIQLTKLNLKFVNLREAMHGAFLSKKNSLNSILLLKIQNFARAKIQAFAISHFKKIIPHWPQNLKLKNIVYASKEIAAFYAIIPPILLATWMLTKENLSLNEE